MKINSNLKKTMKLKDFNPGECFIFIDTKGENIYTEIYIKTDMDIIVRLLDGMAYNYYDVGEEDALVEEIKAELNIL